MPKKSHYDYIVIGSGFGGSVSAMRLSEKNYSVLVIEKGKRWHSSDFPKTNWNLRKFFWFPLIKCFGFQNIAFFRKVFVLSGVGVGGGSLVYANTHYVAPDPFYKNPSWAHLNDWKNVLAPFYKKAEYMLGTVKNTLLDKEDFLLKEIAQEMDCAESFDTVKVGINFNKELDGQDPYFNGSGPVRNACKACAACMVGCRHNAKNTLDKNYLFFAEKNGAEILAEYKVEKIEFLDNLYHIYAYKSTAWFFKEKKTFTSKGIVFSGGVLGTMELLFKQKFVHKTLTKISDTLGSQVRTNFESLCGVTSKNVKLNNGIAISSVFNPNEHTHIEIVKYPDNSNAMKLFATIAVDHPNPAIRPFIWFKQIISKPWLLFAHFFRKDWAKNSVIFLVMQNLDNALNMSYKNFPFFRLSMPNDLSKVPSYMPIAQEVMTRYANKVNGYRQNAVTEVFFNMSSTAHILGGCPMGLSEKEGVVNKNFAVFNYPNMYILDGSIIQGNLGVNPSLTITALSEYAIDKITEKI